MCIDDSKRRESRPITITSTNPVVNLDSTGTQDLESIELMGYNIHGVPTPSGYPYVDYFVVRASGNGLQCPYMSTYESGIGTNIFHAFEIQLMGPSTTERFATPQLIFKRLGDGYGGKTNMSISFDIVTNNGLAVVFDRLTLFLNYVYPAQGKEREIGKHAAISQHNKTFI